MLLVASFPTSPNEIESWAGRFNRSIDQAERRYAHYLVLRSLADDPIMRRSVVVHGGSVASYVFDSGRTPHDIDLYMRGRHNNTISEKERQDLIRQTSLALSLGTRKFCPDFNQWRDKLREYIKVELYGPAAIFFETPFAMDPKNSSATIQVTDLSSTVAGKYHALMSPQSREGKRSSHQKDTFDAASMILLHRDKIDPGIILRCLMSNPAPHWPKDLAPSELFTPFIKKQAEEHYDARIKDMTADRYIEFNQAWQILIQYFEVIRSTNVT